MRANDEKPAEKALMASSSVAVTSEDSANISLAILMPPAESLPDEVRVRGSINAFVRRGTNAEWSKSATRNSAFFTGLRAGYSKNGAAIRNYRIHRSSVVTRRAATEQTGAATRYRGVRPNKNNNDDDNNINNNNHAALAEYFQPSTLHKLRQLGLSTDKDTPDDNNIDNKNLAALAECFQLSTTQKLRQPALYSNTDTPDGNGINNNNHVALAERFQPGTLYKMRQLGRYSNTDAPDTAHQLDAEAVPAEVTHIRTNTQPSCSGGGESDRDPNIFKKGMGGLRHHTS